MVAILGDRLLLMGIYEDRVGSSHRDWGSGENLFCWDMTEGRQGLRHRGTRREVKVLKIIISIIFNICTTYSFKVIPFIKIYIY